MKRDAVLLGVLVTAVAGCAGHPAPSPDVPGVDAAGDLGATDAPRADTAAADHADAPPADAAGGDDATVDGGPRVIFYDDFAGSALGPAWTVISRHGEYAQSETECNTAAQVSVAGSNLTLATVAQATRCGDFNLDGTVRHAPASWPYATGDVQWSSFNFTYGTVTIRARFPAQGTGTWPALWLLGSNCQATNPRTADVGYDSCPDLGSTDYAEVDMVECDLNNWCQLALSNVGDFPTCGFHMDPTDSAYHVFQLVWTRDAVAVSIDGVDTGCSFASPRWVIPSTPMFLIMQTQTGGAGGSPHNGSLPTSFAIDYVRVTQP